MLVMIIEDGNMEEVVEEEGDILFFNLSVIASLEKAEETFVELQPCANSKGYCIVFWSLKKTSINLSSWTTLSGAFKVGGRSGKMKKGLEYTV